MSCSVFEHEPPSAAEIEDAQEALTEWAAECEAFRAAHRRLAQTAHRLGILDRSGFKPPYRDTLSAPEAIEGVVDLAGDTIKNAVDAARLADLCERAEAEE